MRISPSLGSRKKILNPPRLLVPLINIRNEKIKSWLTLRPHSWIEPGTQKISASPKQDFLLHVTTSRPPTIKALRTTKITKLGLEFLPSLVFNWRFTIPGLKSKYMCSPTGKRSWTTRAEIWFPFCKMKSDLLTTRPIKLAHYPKTFYTSHLIPGVKPYWHFTYWKQCNTIFSFHSILIP